jgi:RimJ/RimL family protein N-acetyltransferase
VALVLRGRAVTLRPLREEDFAAVRAGMEESYGAPLEPGSDGLLRERIARSGDFEDGWLDLGIEADGRLVGDVGARSPRGAFPPGVFELGISIFAQADRGRGLGGEAVSLITGHLFDELGAARVQATTALSNAPMRAVLARLGFAEEGVLRAFMPAGNGSRADYVMYAVTREDWRSRVTP